MKTFIALKTEYSITKSTITVKEGVKLAKELGYSSVLIADDKNLFASLDFATEAIKNKIFPIIGVTVEVQFDSRLHKLILVAKTEEGFQNLLFLTYEYEVIEFEILKNYLKDVVILIFSSCQNLISNFVNLCDKSDLYLAITRISNSKEDLLLEEELLSCATVFDIAIIYSNEAYFQNPEMHEPQDVLNCIGSGHFLLEDDREKTSINNYFKSPSEIQNLFSDIPEALDMAEALKLKISFVPKPSKPLLPSFADDEKHEMELKSKQGLEERFQNNEALGLNKDFTKQDYQDRLKYEIDVISNMGFCGYFLIVADFINWSKNNKIPVGPGRGSGAGSLVAFSLGITNIDPLYYGLLFERFLNPERVSMPDFDIDFCPDGREKVTEYVQNKYGNQNVAGIITFGRLQARAVLKDVGRVLQIPYFVVDKICKLIPFNPVAPVSLGKAIELDPELQAKKEDDQAIAKLIEIGLKLEGLIRHSSVHAAGVIIADRPLIKLVPLLKNTDNSLPVVGYHMKAAEQAGLVKFDFLGLKTLTIISNICKMIKEQLSIEIDISKVPINDSKTFALLQSGLTLGIFQLESLICKDAMKQMKIDRIEDAIALTSLNRPGPMENIPSFINRKLGKEEISYPHLMLKEILAETYGIIIYQEQVIQIAQVLAGYTLGQADLLRRAMGKKIKAEMDAQRSFFIDGAFNNGIEKTKASEIFDLVDKFAGYGFNKSHAAAYTEISYQTAYLKAHFPVQFFVSNLNMSIASTDDINLFVNDARSMGIKVHTPSINTSLPLFATDGKEIFYGLSALKSVGVGSMEEVVEIRNKGGDFIDIFDFCKRVGNKNANKKQIESLTKSGAFDCLNINRKQILESVEVLTKFASDTGEESSNAGLFDFAEISYNPKLKPVKEDFTSEQNLLNEFEAIGFYLSFHPLNNYLDKLESAGFTKFRDLEEKLGEKKERRFKMAGIISIVKQRSGAKGRFAFVHLSEVGSIFEACIFKDEIITQNRDNLAVGTLVAINVSVSKQADTGSLRIIIQDIANLDESLKNCKPVKREISTKELPIAKIVNNSESVNFAQEFFRSKYLIFKIHQIDITFLENFSIQVQNFKSKDGKTNVFFYTPKFKIKLDGSYNVPEKFVKDLRSQGIEILDDL